MSYTQHSGRVSALAVALGLGVGVLWSPGVAIADSPDGGTSASSPSDDGKADAGSSDGSTGPADNQPGTPTIHNDDESEAASPDTDAETSDAQEGSDGDDLSAPDDTSGSIADDDGDETVTDPPNGSDAQEPPVDTPPVVPSTPTPPAPATPPVHHDTPSVGPKDDGIEAATPPPHHEPLEETTTAPGSPQEVASSQLNARNDESEDGPVTALVAAPAASAQRSSLSVTAVAPLAADAPNPLAVLLTTPVRIVTAVVGALLSPFLAPATPATPAPPTLWAVLAWAREELQRTFFNRTPRLAAAPTDVEQVDDVVTGALVGVDPDGDPLTYSVTPTTAKGGTVTVDEAGNFTYTAPTTWNGVDPLTDTFTVSAVDSGFHFHGLRGLFFGTGHSTTREVTVQLTGAVAAAGEPITVAVPPTWTSPRTRVGPDGTVVVTQRFGSGTESDPFVTQMLVQNPGRPAMFATASGIVVGGLPLVAPDGTVYLTTVIPAPDGSAQTTVTTVLPGQAAVSWTSPSSLVANPTLTPDGDLVVTTASGSGAADDTRTTVVVISDGQPREALNLDGVMTDFPTIGADGTIALAVTGADGGTLLGVLRPGGAAEYQELPGVAQGPVVIADDGTIVVRTLAATGFAAARASSTTTTVWIQRPGESAMPIIVDGIVGDVVTGGGGTIAYASTTGAGTDSDPVQTTVTVLRPGSADQVSTVTGALVGGVVIGVDGTVAFNTYAGDPQRSPMTVTVLRPDGSTQNATYTTVWSYRIRPVVGADGTVAAIWADDGMTVAVLRPGQAPIIDTNPNFITIAPVVGADGTVAYTVGDTTSTGENFSEVVVLRPGQSTRHAGIYGYGWGITVTDDGTVVSSTRVDRTLSYVMVLRPNGESVIAAAPGLIANPAQVASNGVVYLPTQSASGNLNVTIVHPSNRSVTLEFPGRLSDFTLDAAGGGTEFVIATIDASGNVVLTIRPVFVATVAPAPSAATLV